MGLVFLVLYQVFFQQPCAKIKIPICLQYECEPFSCSYATVYDQSRLWFWQLISHIWLGELWLLLVWWYFVIQLNNCYENQNGLILISAIDVISNLFVYIVNKMSIFNMSQEGGYESSFLHQEEQSMDVLLKTHFYLFFFLVRRPFVNEHYC